MTTKLIPPPRAVVAVVALMAPVAASAQAPVAEVAPVVATDARANVQVTARILVVDRDEATRVGLGYLVVDPKRVRLQAAGHATDGGTVGVLGATAFLELIRERRLVRSESTQRVLVLSGGAARVASSELAVGRHGARTRGPTMTVIPTTTADGRVHLWVDTRLEDSVTWWWGYGVDGSPAAVDTELLAWPGEDVIVAGGTVTETTRDGGLLRRGTATLERDVLIVMSVEVLE